MRHFVQTLLLCLLIAAVAQANRVSFQGILTNSSGDSLLTGTYDFSFAIFPTETGGTARWTEAHPDVEVENGVYSVLFGSTTPLPDSIGANNWLQITVEGTTLAPRLPINADFRAIEARHAQNADSVNHIGARATPTPNHLLPLDAQGKFPESVMPFTLDSIVAGQGLTGIPVTGGEFREGRNSLDERLTINVGAGTGITVTADQVSATLGTSISTDELENNAVTNAKLADNAVNSAKVQDNTLAAADISTDIVSSVDGVINDGGNIDLIAGPNITITPNDANNTITFAATGGGGGYSAGRCIALNGTVINNTMALDNFDNCFDIQFDSVTCTYTLSSFLDLLEGECIDIEYDEQTCDWSISVDPACIDSVYDTELYAQSFMVIGDGTIEEPRAHLRNDGGLEMRDGDGNEVYINPNGTMVIVRDGVPVGGYDANGEFFAQSFMVVDSETGDTLSHLNSDGGIELYGEDGAILLNPNGTMAVLQNGQLVAGLDGNGEYFAKSFMVIDPETGDTISHLTNDGALTLRDEYGYVGLSTAGLFIGDSAGQSGVVIDDFGNIALLSEGTAYAGVNGFTGEVYARSFEMRDSLDGELKAHLSNDGNLALPQGAQITIGGVPIGGGEGDTIRRTSAGDSSEFGSFGVDVFDGLFESWARPESLGTGSRDGEDKAVLRSDGCIESYQNGDRVAGVDASGEIFAKSFYVRNPDTGDTLLHITNTGQMVDANGQVLFDGTRIMRDGVNDVSISAESGISTSDGFLGTGISKTGLLAANFETGNSVNVRSDGTWQAERDFVPIAALDSTGEIIAKSFEVRDSVTGATKAHLTNAGNLELPQGAQVLIGGVPIGGGGGGPLDIEDEDSHTSVDANGIVTGTNDLENNVLINPDGTWDATQNGVTVAGLQGNGEIHAKSFEVRDSAGGAILAHLYKEGANGRLFVPNGTVSAGTVFGANTIYSSSVNGNTQLATDMTAGWMRTQTLVSGVPNGGWSFLNNGQMTQYVGGVVNMQATADGYWMFNMPLFIGPQNLFNYFYYQSPYDGIQVNGNFKVNGKLTVTGGTDPIIEELFLTKSEHKYEVGTVLIADPHSERFIPCNDAYLTSVVGVVSPEIEIDENGYILATILGAAAAFREDGTRLESVVKADAQYGPIKRGDLLTTSPTEGHAMLAAEPKLGTIVGKALESLESGTGEIKVMVTLQ